MVACWQSIVTSYLFLSFVCDSYLSTLYTSSDEEYLSNLIQSSQDRKSGLFEKSLTTTYYATQALLTLNTKIPKRDDLCSTLKSQKISSWEEFHNLMLSRSRIPNCLDSISDSSHKKLKDGLSANKLSKVYYSISGIHALSQPQINLFDTSSLDIIETLTHIQTFQLSNHLFSESATNSKAKSSIHKSSMALSAASKVLICFLWYFWKLSARFVFSYYRCQIWVNHSANLWNLSKLNQF